MKFLIDENLPPRLAKWLVERGHDAEHVREAGLNQTPDATLAARAVAEDRAIVTQDADFDDPTPPLRVLRLRLGNASVGALLAWLEPRLGAALAQFQAGAHYVEIE